MATNIKTKKKEKRVVQEAQIYIQATFNNTIVTLADMEGNTLAWSSSGSLGFKGAKKSTPFAAQTVVDKLLSENKDNLALRDVYVYIKGPGTGRDSAIRTVVNSGLNVKMIQDVTPIAHNGCRPKKMRRM